ncbi:hypothetical protein [Mucilaginibacter celer]|uniref:Uncharacterized protein n=1 Tax=Mucilaginibacter celer TaxID=2305508 RepID=A0A494VRX2_9SPHI|nr:hypothetical protein [Mucilaginibacter celer]AYL98357.1 hypothetical protein HYN43_025075 [Mucilaginibacter celer]
MSDKQKLVLSSTHLDSQGMMMTKEALLSGLSYLNGDRMVKLGVEHIRTFPPMGAIINGEVTQGKDEAYYLIGEATYFDNKEQAVLDDGSVIIKESFLEGGKPFWESKIEEINIIEISTDPANFESFNNFNEFINILNEGAEFEFASSMTGRKSALPDPELIIKLTQTIVLALGIGATKIPEKVGEAIGEDIVKFYKFLSKAVVEIIKRAVPANRPKNFVIQYNYLSYLIELIVTTHKHDEVLNSVTKEKLKTIKEKIERLKNLKPEKIQFIFNENKEWEFNYLLTEKGEAIGSEKAFKNRDEMYKNLLKNN